MTTWTLTHTPERRGISSWSPRRLRNCEGTRKCSGNSRVIDPLLKYSLTTFHSFKSVLNHRNDRYITTSAVDVKGNFKTKYPAPVRVLDDFRREKMPAFFYKLGEMVDVDALLYCPGVPCFAMVEG